MEGIMSLMFNDSHFREGGTNPALSKDQIFIKYFKNILKKKQMAFIPCVVAASVL